MQYAGLQNVYNSYNGDLTTYNGLKDAYNTANTAEKDRDADFGKWLFEPKTEIPERPCPPTQPAAWWGVKLVLAQGVQSTPIAFSTFTTNMQAYIQGTTATAPAASTAMSTMLGYNIAADTGVAAATPTVTNVGKTFGLFGQGKANLYTESLPFSWASATAGTDFPTLMVSFFPQTSADTGLAASTDKVAMKVKGQAFQALSNFEAPSQPSAAANPDKVWNNAAALSGATLLASAVVLASLA